MCGTRGSELQELANASGFWSYARDRQPGVYQVVIEYLDEEAGRYAARAAVLLSIVDRGRYPKGVRARPARFERPLPRCALGPSTEAIVKEAEA